MKIDDVLPASFDKSPGQERGWFSVAFLLCKQSDAAHFLKTTLTFMANIWPGEMEQAQACLAEVFKK